MIIGGLRASWQAQFSPDMSKRAWVSEVIFARLSRRYPHAHVRVCAYARAHARAQARVRGPAYAGMRA